MQVYLLTQLGYDVRYLDTTQLKEGPEEIQSIEELLELLISRVAEILGDSTQGTVLVAPGYVQNLKGGINTMFERGFTDPVTGLISLGALYSLLYSMVEFELQKDVPGIMSTNPKDLTDGDNRVQLVPAVSVKLSEKLFGPNGAKSGLVNASTFSKHVVNAIRERSDYRVKIGNPANKTGECTYIQQNVEVVPGKLQIIQSREDVPDRFKQGLGTGGVNSLYLIGEDLQPLNHELLEKVNELLKSKIKGVNYYLKNGSDMLIINFSDDNNPMHTIEKEQKRYRKLEKKISNAKLKMQNGGFTESKDDLRFLQKRSDDLLETIWRMQHNVGSNQQTAKEKRLLALDILHRELIEKQNEAEHQIAKAA